MRVLVLVKRCIDYAAPIRIKPDGSGVEISGAKMSMNPFDEIAVEESVRLKENGIVTDILVLAIGPAQAQDTLRQALAMGVDRAAYIAADVYPEPLDVAKTVAALAQRENIDLILLGKQAIDDDFGHEGAMIAAMLNWNFAPAAASITPGDPWRISCETESGLVDQIITLPAVITADLRLNTPRAAPLPKVLEARKKPIEAITFADLGIAPRARLSAQHVEAPKPREAVTMLNSIDELEQKLREAMT